MTSPHWQLKEPINAVVFDCDGTLTTVEGIDELAKNNGASQAVAALTAEAMGVSGINPSLYQQRLLLTLPTKQQIEDLGHHYFTHQVPDAKAVIQILERLKKSIYIVSAGLKPAVTLFGELMQIPPQNIFAVDIQFDQYGHYVDFERTSPLVTNNGKLNIITQLNKKYRHLAHVGDGLNDYVTHQSVSRFIGYGGVYYRENLAKACEYYISTLSMSPLLPLTLTETEYQHLTSQEKILYHKGLSELLSKG